MLEVIASTRSEMSPALFKALARYRYDVFVKGLGWALPCAEGFEVDAFDRPDTVYVLARDSRQEIVGCARLIPTDRPFLLGEVFPQLMGDTPLPSSSTVWELSRFASRRPLSRRAQVMRAWHDTTWLMSKVIGVAQTLGARRLIAFSAPGNERLLRRMGVSTHRIAGPQMVNEFPVVPFWINVAGYRHRAVAGKTQRECQPN
ncbi:UNVERIFIED_ORG: N-acyl-L-homoserine lactone synthetase [Pseudomonas lini]|uniref:Acyl-homoserine-lactone synthase n=1 Tax=Pseudomonas viciae TaxID=2505979 RepID=A0A4P7PI87_9PSED|nr:MULTISPECIES: acyl-homoserine-lactone synthase [Pseudomonas]QBZ90386.1 GNAT family N-acetyltransferase [Pseudomonas viciae]UZE84424.1 GNAT family N-acetyltransferase [Pseudomonas viciae]WGO91342.1 acyl-homoserine-lactone synthase [Pseudomonas viciae]WHS62600.1 acyl-homoserine-lactone synthase [Pseudomonas sp. G2-4]